MTNIGEAILELLEDEPMTDQELADTLYQSRARVRNALHELYFVRDAAGKPAGTGLLCDRYGRYYPRDRNFVPHNGSLLMGYDPGVQP
jgi:hypothetical protein